jgi:hypothetical protein
MVLIETRKLIRKFLVLGILLGCLGFVSSGVGTKATAKTDSFKPCCSVCEPDPTIPICRFGCIEGC